MTLILCHGGMYSGKSDMAISRVRAFTRHGFRRVLYQPQKNTRDIFQNKPVWFSRAGGDEITLLPAKWFVSADEVLRDMGKYDVFGFEEGQMYSPEAFEVIKQLHEAEKHVVCSMLDYYSNGEPVEIFDKLRSLDGAVLLPGVNAICQDCNADGKNNMAVRTQRTYNGLPEPFDSDKIVVEGSQGYAYKPVCLKHWKVNPPINSNLSDLYQKFYLGFVKTTLK